MQSVKTKKRVFGAVQTVFLCVVAIFFLVPLYLTITNAFKESSAVMQAPMSLPIPPVFDGIKRILSNKSNNIFAMYRNSAILMLFAVPINIVVSSLASYYIARSRTRASRFLSVYFLAGLMVPYVIVYIPLSILIRLLGLSFSLPVLIFVFVSGGISFATFMYTNFIKSVPLELEEAAALDGAGKLFTFWTILFPLLKPCTATVVIFNGLSVWNDFMTPLLLGQVKTITVGIYTAIGPHSTDWSLVFGYLLFAMLPVIILFLLMQKQFIAGLTAGAAKG